MNSPVRPSPDTDTLLAVYKLNKQLGGNLLDDWLSASGQLTDFQRQLLDEVYHGAINRIAGWNEEELKVKFVSFLFSSQPLKKRARYPRFMSAKWRR